MKENTLKNTYDKETDMEEQSQEYSLNIKFVSMTKNRFFADDLSCKPREFHAFIFIEDGTASVNVNDKYFSVRKNDIMLIPSGSAACMLSRSDDFETRCCNFNAELNGTSLFRHCSPPYHCSLSEVPSVKPNLIKIEQYLGTGDVLSVLKAESHLMHMITDFLEAEPVIGKYNSTNSSDFSRRIRLYVENRISSKITVESMAAEMGYHPKYFTSLFKKHMGTTPAKYIKDARINKAKQLLVNSNINISDIAVLSGFSTQPKFANDFKKLVGMTASEYRAANRNTEN